MNTTTSNQPLFGNQERILETEGLRKGWMVDFRVHYTEREAPYRIAGEGPILEPEWNVDVRAERGTARITASIYETDPDRVRFLARRFIEELPE